MVELRITVPVLKVLQVFIAAGPDEHLYGLALSEHTGLKSGTLYPVLARLERASWITSDWEEVDPREAGRPRRRYYHLTGLGRRAGTAELAKFGRPSLPPNRSRKVAPNAARPAWGQA
ncbi:hypothetical protein GCM10009804_73530 [Kribbella hippodromi]|uniref:Transcription regulator PadR N-terminal domain-containing protein n=1 Tax=Kribbella hippodromi TaxID=434347 RepID=A0ABN2EGU9_9ACTN